MSNELNKKWVNYLEMIVPSEAGEHQVIETKRAFYAGASVMLGKILACADGEEAHGAAIIESLRQEILEFAAI